jgi:hypothetical protein
MGEYVRSKLGNDDRKYIQELVSKFTTWMKTANCWGGETVINPPDETYITFNELCSYASIGIYAEGVVGFISWDDSATKATSLEVDVREFPNDGRGSAIIRKVSNYFETNDICELLKSERAKGKPIYAQATYIITNDRGTFTFED